MLTNNRLRLAEASDASVLGLWMAVFSLCRCVVFPLCTPLSSSLLTEKTRTHPCDLICKALSPVQPHSEVELELHSMNGEGTTEGLPYANLHGFMNLSKPCVWKCPQVGGLSDRWLVGRDRFF